MKKTKDLAHPKKPCKDCPFRREGGIRLRPGRIEEIVGYVAPEDGGGGSFQCHKTLKKGPDLQCAGALIFAYKQGRSSNFCRIMERLGMIDRDLVDGDHPEIFDDIDEMMETSI